MPPAESPLLTQPTVGDLVSLTPLASAWAERFFEIAPIALAVYLAAAIVRRSGALVLRRLDGAQAATRHGATSRGAMSAAVASDPTDSGGGTGSPSRFWHAVLDGVDAQICILDAFGRIVETNQAWDRFATATEASTEGALGGNFKAFSKAARAYGAEGATEVAEAVRDVAAGIRPGFTKEYPASMGRVERLIEVQVKPLPAGRSGSVIVLQHDRTHEREAQQQILAEKRKAETLAGALETSQQSLELAVNGGNLGLWHWDVTTGYLELSSEWLEQLGHDAVNRDANVESLRDLLHPDELVLWTAEDAASVAGGEPYDRQFRLRRADGSYLWMQALGSVNSLLPDGSPESMSGILMDIDARKNVELRDAGLAQIIEDSFNEVYICDLETNRFIEVNRGARENLGYSMDELQKMAPTDIKVSMTAEQRLEQLAPIISGEAPKIEFESVHKRRDGSTYPILLSLQRGRLLERDVIVGIGTDLTQRRELETQLAQAQKLESIGQLAAGVAHEMNTPLQYVSNNIRFLSDCSDSLFEVLDTYSRNLDFEASPADWKQRVEEIREASERNRFEHVRAELPEAIADSLDGVERVLHIVRAMKEFSHPGGLHKTPTDLNRALTSTATVTRNRWKYAGELKLDLDPGLPAVECDPGEINQVFVNLIVNAADAVTERRENDPDSPEGEIVVRSKADGEVVTIEVEDNGVGMPPAVLQRIFDPFYTTKEVGQGTGQGLSLSHTIVTQKHGGSITAKSEPGCGTLFRVSLPLVDPYTAAEAPESQKPCDAAVGQES